MKMFVFAVVIMLLTFLGLVVKFSRWGKNSLKCFHRNLTGFELQKKSLKVPKDLSGRRRALFGKTISVNDLYYFASVNELG